MATQYQNVYAPGLVTCTIPKFVVACDGKRVRISQTVKTEKDIRNVSGFQLRFDNQMDEWDGSCSSNNGDFCIDNFPSTVDEVNLKILEKNIPGTYKTGSNYKFWYAPVNKDGTNGNSSEQIEFSCDEVIPQRINAYAGVYCDSERKYFNFHGPVGLYQEKGIGFEKASFRLNDLQDGWNGSCSSSAGDKCVDSAEQSKLWFVDGFVPGHYYEVWANILNKDNNDVDPNPTHYFFKCGDDAGLSK